MQLDNQFVVVISSTSPDDIPGFIRKMFKDCRLSGSKKLMINFLSNKISYPEFVQNARESILDNVDLGIYVYIWKPEEIDQMIRKVLEIQKDIKGFIVYCDNDNKQLIERLSAKIPNSIKAKIIKDYCK
ncbi:MAG: DUF5751 family protein [Saccharolobus sp.]